MNTKKTIVGLEYSGGLNLVGIDIETETSVNLGRRIYVIVKDPFLTDAPQSGMQSIRLPAVIAQRLFIDIADELTGRQYRVEFHPGNICEADKAEPKKEVEQESLFVRFFRERALRESMRRGLQLMYGAQAPGMCSIDRILSAPRAITKSDIESIVDAFNSWNGGLHE